MSPMDEGFTELIQRFEEQTEAAQETAETILKDTLHQIPIIDRHLWLLNLANRLAGIRDQYVQPLVLAVYGQDVREVKEVLINSAMWKPVLLPQKPQKNGRQRLAETAESARKYLEKCFPGDPDYGIPAGFRPKEWTAALLRDYRALCKKFVEQGHAADELWETHLHAACKSLQTIKNKRLTRQAVAKAAAAMEGKTTTKSKRTAKTAFRAQADENSDGEDSSAEIELQLSARQPAKKRKTSPPAPLRDITNRTSINTRSRRRTQRMLQADSLSPSAGRSLRSRRGTASSFSPEIQIGRRAAPNSELPDAESPLRAADTTFKQGQSDNEEEDEEEDDVDDDETERSDAKDATEINHLLPSDDEVMLALGGQASDDNRGTDASGDEDDDEDDDDDEDEDEDDADAGERNDETQINGRPSSIDDDDLVLDDDISDRRPKPAKRPLLVESAVHTADRGQSISTKPSIDTQHRSKEESFVVPSKESRDIGLAFSDIKSINAPGPSSKSAPSIDHIEKPIPSFAARLLERKTVRASSLEPLSNGKFDGAPGPSSKPAPAFERSAKSVPPSAPPESQSASVQPLRLEPDPLSQFLDLYSSKPLLSAKLQARRDPAGILEQKSQSSDAENLQELEPSFNSSTSSCEAMPLDEPFPKQAKSGSAATYAILIDSDDDAAPSADAFAQDLKAISRCLVEHEWLDDIAVFETLDLLVNRKTCILRPSSRPSDSLRRNAMQTCTTILYPQCRGAHWTLGFVETEYDTSGFFDSLSTKPVARDRLQNFRDVLRGIEKELPEPCENIKCTEQQRNMSDCGVHLLANAFMYVLDSTTSSVNAMLWRNIAAWVVHTKLEASPDAAGTSIDIPAVSSVAMSYEEAIEQLDAVHRLIGKAWTRLQQDEHDVSRQFKDTTEQQCYLGGLISYLEIFLTKVDRGGSTYQTQLQQLQERRTESQQIDQQSNFLQKESERVKKRISVIQKILQRLETTRRHWTQEHVLRALDKEEEHAKQIDQAFELVGSERQSLRIFRQQLREAAERGDANLVDLLQRVAEREEAVKQAHAAYIAITGVEKEEKEE